MNRGVITISESGTVSMPTDTVWMTMYNPQNEMLPFHKTKCSETQNEMSSL